MANIVDSLIVELRLDPAQFSEGQRRAADSLRQLENSANQSGQRISRSGEGVATFFRTLEHPVASLRRQFETLAGSTVHPQRNLSELAAQGRRTGAGIEAGALTGAAGLRVLGAAGLGAFTAITALDKAMSAASDSAKNVFGASIGAAAAGTPIGQFTAISQALLKAGNVPEAETQGLMARLRTAQVQASIGNYRPAAALNTEFARMGIQANAFEDSPEKVLLAIAKRFHEVSADMAIGYADSIGMSATLAKALHDLGDAGLRAAIEASRHTAVTKDESEAARQLTDAQNKLAASWDKLTRVIFNFIDGPLAKMTAKFAEIIDHTTEGLPRVWDKVKGWLGLGPFKGIVSGPGASAPGTAGPGAGVAPSGSRFNEAVNFFTSKGLTPAQAIGVASRLNAESGLDPSITNASGHTGIAQWDRTRAAGLGGSTDFQKQLEYVWQEFQTTEAAAFAKIKAAGPAADAARAMEAYERAGNPSFTEKAAADAAAAEAAMRARNRLPDPNTLTGNARQPPPGPGAGIVGSGYNAPNTAAGRALAAGGSLPIYGLTPSLSGENVGAKPNMGAWEQLKIIQGAQSDAGTVNHHYGDVSIGDIHTAASTPDGIADAVADRARRNFQVTQTNTGLM